MKTIEQKARDYDKAIEKLRSLYDDYDNISTLIDIKEELEHIFPELKERNGEKIRKSLIKWLQSNSYTSIAGIQINDVIDWLKKQGEQKPYGQRKECLNCQFNYTGECKGSCQMKRDKQKSADKVEPKFHEGDWIVFNGLTLHIIEVVNYIKQSVKGFYRTITIDGMHNSYDWDIDNAARLWTIQDAKDGDVLACESGWTCIFKTLVNDENFSSYCFMDNTKWFCETGSECHTLKEEFVKAYNGKIYPATKEQCELLFQKIKEAGYEWNSEKKELKKIIDENQIKKNLQDNSFRRMFDQKREWSEEDSVKLQRIIDFLWYNRKGDTDAIYQQEQDIDWLKSLKDRYTWKPSDEQVAALADALSLAKSCGEERAFDLRTLYEQLKKLKE